MAEIRELDPLRIALTVRELGAKPVNSMTDSEIFELIRRLKMLTAIPAGVEESVAAVIGTPPDPRDHSRLSLEPGTSEPATAVTVDLPAPPPPPPPGWLPPPPPPPI